MNKWYGDDEYLKAHLLYIDDDVLSTWLLAKLRQVERRSVCAELSDGVLAPS